MLSHKYYYGLQKHKQMPYLAKKYSANLKSQLQRKREKNLHGQKFRLIFKHI